MQRVLFLLALFTGLIWGQEYLPAVDTTVQVIHHFAYTVGYSPKYRQAKWVYYKLTKQHVLHHVTERADKFRPDPLVPDGPTPEEYKHSGYDRGHLAPAADFKWSVQAEEECFFMTNMSPQFPALNRGLWALLESQVRDWAVKDGDLYICTGGVLKDSLKSIGQHIAVPDVFYKVLLHVEGEKVKGIGFLVPNEKVQGPFSAFAVSIDSVEKVSGVDFYPELADSVEIPVERHFCFSDW